jgi:hypothetical protein
VVNSEERARAGAEERERATGEATSLIRAHFEDPEAWVRLLVTEGAGDETIYHFDAFGPTLTEQSRVLVYRAGADLWEAVLDD